MIKPRTSLTVLLLLVGMLALVLPASGLATGATAAPAPAAEAQTEAVPPGPEPAGTQTGTASTPTPVPTPRNTSTTASPPSAPQVQQQFSQGVTPGAPAPAAKPKAGAGTGEAPGAGESAAALRARLKALSPSALTPSLPLALQSSLAGVPGFFIESFRIPPFLLPIFQAAGTAYGIPWQVLAAINEVETDYGRDLNVSSAGAEGWMQFLPSSWAQYGVDANGDGFKDPYNPADAIFAAARYLRAAGGDTDIRAAVFAYNHSQAYVDSVMLRAQLLGGTPSELLGAITGVTEARFPVHAAAHFSDGFPSVPGVGGGPARTLVGTSIYSSAGAAVIAVQDGEVVQLGESPELGRFLSLRDAFGNTYTYAHLGDVATVYPVLQPHVNSTVSSNVSPQGPHEPTPTGPATAGAQPRSPVSEAATVSGLALGAAAGLEATPTTTSAPAPKPPAPAPAPASVTTFRAGINDVFLHPLSRGVQVISGTVLGHVGAGTAASGEDAPHIVFQIRPAALGAPLIDPKPILDGWVALENTSIFRARGQNPFLATSPTVGQVLLESKQQLVQQVLHDGGIALGRCGREAVQGGRVDKRLLALLEYLSVSGLKPTVAGLGCSRSTSPASAANAAAGSSAETIDIVAIDGTPVAGHQTPGSVVDAAVRKLLMLQGAARPKRVVSLMSYPGATGAVANPSARAAIRVTFATDPGVARTAGLGASTLSPSEWIRLVARLGEIPDPTVARAPSAAAIPVNPGAAAAAGEGTSGGNH